MVDKALWGTIGPRIRFFRERARLSQDELASLLQYESGSSMISQVERGCAGMSVEQAIKAAKILKVNPSALLSERELSNEEIELLSEFLTLLENKTHPNMGAIQALIKAST